MLTMGIPTNQEGTPLGKEYAQQNSGKVRYIPIPQSHHYTGTLCHSRGSVLFVMANHFNLDGCNIYDARVYEKQSGRTPMSRRNGSRPKGDVYFIVGGSGQLSLDTA